MAPSILVPEKLPGMILPDCNLFPHNGLPLFIFEDRYRVMLEHVLETNRLFFVVQARDPGEVPHALLGEAHEYATVGMVRAGLENEDGTSHLFLHGLQRIRLKAFDPTSEYPLADVELVETNEGDPMEIGRLQAALLTEIEELSEGRAVVMDMLEPLRGADKAEICADVVGARILQDRAAQREFLSLSELRGRFEFLAGHLHDVGWKAL